MADAGDSAAPTLDEKELDEELDEELELLLLLQGSGCSASPYAALRAKAYHERPAPRKPHVLQRVFSMLALRRFALATDDADALRALRAWCAADDGACALTPQERQHAQSAGWLPAASALEDGAMQPVAAPSQRPSTLDDAVWCERVGVLLWSLKLLPALPAFGCPIPGHALEGALAALEHTCVAAWPDARCALRGPEYLERAHAAAEMWYWRAAAEDMARRGLVERPSAAPAVAARAREARVRGLLAGAEADDFPLPASEDAAWMRAAAVSLVDEGTDVAARVHLLHLPSDAAVGGGAVTRVPFSSATPGQLECVLLVARERWAALNWLVGLAQWDAACADSVWVQEELGRGGR